MRYKNYRSLFSFILILFLGIIFPIDANCQVVLSGTNIYGDECTVSYVLRFKSN